jgi:hypothetical protein
MPYYAAVTETRAFFQVLTARLSSFPGFGEAGVVMPRKPQDFAAGRLNQVFDIPTQIIVRVDTWKSLSPQTS